MSRTLPMIAVVDDEDDVRRGLQRLLHTAGMDVRTYESDDFLSEIDDIDCVILDLHMPGVDGFEIQEAMRARGMRVPVIVLTGNDSPTNRARSLANGAGAYLTKPIDDDVLLRTIRRLLENDAAA
jgi:FixJ family two-component response regulator